MMKLNSIKISVYLFVLTNVSWSLHGQISINADDILGIIGQTQMIEHDSSGAVAVDVGSAGPNQVWDFSAANADALLANYEHLRPEDAPIPTGSFATANMVEKITLDGVPVTLYNFREVTDNEIVNLGNLSQATFNGMSFDQINQSRRTLAPLPITYENTWSEIVNDTVTSEFSTMIIADTNTYSVDAWGTVILPQGQIPVLRLRNDSRSSFSLMVGGFVGERSRSLDISYFWISKENLIVAWATSLDGETDPNFTNASFFARLIDEVGTTSVADASMMASQAFTSAPNPFREKTDFRFSITEASNVQIEFYDNFGRRLDRLILGKLAAGDHQVTWTAKRTDGRDLPPGLYNAVLHSGSGPTSHQIMKIR
ncbi:MAG: hypothetical protein HKN87_11975 [Saprospiraceae bacterium]|nr:hypothetical protein [Saprospiraceae bacterium]